MPYSQFQNVAYIVTYVIQQRMHINDSAGTPLMAGTANYRMTFTLRFGNCTNNLSDSQNIVFVKIHRIHAESTVRW